MAFKTLDIRQRRAGIPERQETRELSPKLLQLGEFPAKRSTETEEPRESGTCPRVSRQSLESKLTVAAGVCRTGFNTVTQKERAESWSVRESEETTQLQGKKDPRGSEENTRHSHRAGNIRRCS